MDIPSEDLRLLARDKYAGDTSRITGEDMARLSSGEPLAYVVGWLPFLGLKINLSAKPLIPRPETEWWTELLVHRIADKKMNVLDLCAGSGAIGLAVLKHCPNATVYFGELSESLASAIWKSIDENALDASRAVVRAGDLMKPFPHLSFDIIATNPPYIPESRMLERSVIDFEPKEALFGGEDGLELIRRIAKNAPHHVRPGGEIWMECDIENVAESAALLARAGASSTAIQTDQYGRKRLVLAYY